jgi:hypothetical protein
MRVAAGNDEDRWKSGCVRVPDFDRSPLNAVDREGPGTVPFVGQRDGKHAFSYGRRRRD